MKQVFKLLLTVVACLFVMAPAMAQVTTSGISGYVVEKDGEALVGATVVATHLPTGTKYVASANENGRYAINGMRAGGPYNIQISYIGMSTVEYNDVTLKLGEPFEANAEMISSNELEAIVVVGESAFNAAKTGAASSFNLKAVESMPTIDRSVYDVVKMTPQATTKNGGISFVGSNNRYNSFQIDGAIANDAFGLAGSGTNGGQTGANPVSLDAIEEVQVVVAPFDVRQSGFTGGAINAITKSGTNTVKGTFYSYFNNQDMVGTTAGDVEKREKYSTQLSQTYGITFGAPIIKNKLFIFATGEYYKKQYPNIYNPENGSYNEKPLMAEVFDSEGNSLGNIFNTAMADAMIEHYEKTYGIANTGESYGEHQIEDRSINAMLRLDWNINDRSKMMVRYQFMDAYADQYSAGNTSYTFNNSSYKQSNKTHTFVAELNTRFSDIVSNEFRATAVLVRDKRSVPYAGPNIYINGDAISFSLGTNYSSGANAMNSDAYTLTDNVSIYKGNHNITIGTHNELFKFYNIFLQYAYGGYTYSTVADFFANKIDQFNYRYADPELTNGNTRWGATTWAGQFGVYAQDEWKPNRNLTLTYGIRLDMPVLLNKPTENPSFNESDIAKQNDAYVGQIPSAKVLFSPRFGFRWFLNDNHKTLLRGGAGLFTGRVPFVWLSNAYNNTGMEAKSVTINSPAAGFPMTGDPYNDIIVPGIASAGGKATINTLSRDFKYPQVFRVNIGFDHEFGYGWKFTFDGLYSKTLNNVFFKNLALTDAHVVYGVNEEMANEKNVIPYYSVDNTYQAVVDLQNTNKGYSYSLSGKIEKNFDFGLNFMASYTFGHSYSVNDGTSSVALSNWKYNNSNDTNEPELSFSSFDLPHRVIAMVSYTTPLFAKGLQTNVALTYEGSSGSRYSYTLNESVDLNGDGEKSNSLLYIPTEVEIGKMNWVNADDAANFEAYIRNDKYLRTHRGQWSERYAGVGKFEHHLDFHFAQDFFYDKESGRKLQFIVDFLNITNLMNREWGLYHSYPTELQVLSVTALSIDEKGNATPTYRYAPKEISYADFSSRWRCQLGFRLTF